MTDIEAIAREHGIILRREALACGYDDQWLYRGMRAGLLVRVRQGAYAFKAAWDTASPEERHLLRAAAVVREARRPVVLSHTTAALCLGAAVWDLPLGEVHVTRPDAKPGRHEAGVVRHRGKLRKEDQIQRDGRSFTSALRTAMDVTTITDVPRALVVVCGLLNHGDLTKEDLVAALPRWKTVPGSLTTNLVVRLADERLTSVAEARTFHALWSEGVPLPELQYEVMNERGHLVAKLDFAWPEQRVWLEFDGVGKYIKFLRPGETPADAVVREKKREDEVRRLTGWICVRITWDDLSRPWEIARKVRKAFEDAALHRTA